MIQYLTEEEQYKKYINNEEISRIKDYNLQKIRFNYWRLRHDAFLDEHGISDCDLEKVLDELDLEEEKEIMEYKQFLESNQE